MSNSNLTLQGPGGSVVAPNVPAPAPVLRAVAPAALSARDAIARITFNADGSYAITKENSDLLNAARNAAIHTGELLYVPPSVAKWMTDHGIAATRVLTLPKLTALIPLTPTGALANTAEMPVIMNEILTYLKIWHQAVFQAPSQPVVKWLRDHGMAPSRVPDVAPPPGSVITPAQLHAASPGPDPFAPPAAYAMVPPAPPIITPVSPLRTAPAPDAHLSPDAPDLMPSYSPPQGGVDMSFAPTRSAPPPAPASPTSPGYDRFAERAKWTAYYNLLAA